MWCISIASRECRADCGSSQSVLCRGVCASVRQHVAQSSESRVDVVADRSVWKVILKTRPHVQLGKASGWCVWRTTRAVRVAVLDPVASAGSGGGGMPGVVC